MRISGGQWRSRRLVCPEGRDIRPTAQLVKESIFNMLQTRIYGSRFLDMFAGTGQIGLEALSRGAAEVVFIDKNTDALFKNISFFETLPRVIKGDFSEALRILAAERSCFDIIFADPPYEAGYYARIIAEAGPLLDKNGVLVLEHDRRENIAPSCGLDIIKHREYGRRAVTLFAHMEDQI